MTVQTVKTTISHKSLHKMIAQALKLRKEHNIPRAKRRADFELAAQEFAEERQSIPASARRARARQTIPAGARRARAR